MHRQTERTRNMVEPIKPNEVTQEIPEFVIEAANECIKRNYVEIKKSSVFTQDELIEQIISKVGLSLGVTREQLFKNNWLDIEETYRNAGWKVEYDRPSYYESGKPIFKFKK